MSAARRGGANSMTMARHSGIRPPSPRPATNRPAPNRVGSPAEAQIADPTENSVTLATSIGRRPSQSVTFPVVRAPMSMPNVVQLPIVPALAGVSPSPESSSMCGITAP